VGQVVVVLMGVAGAGKTTIGRQLASRRRWTFVDGDDLHLEANRRKMAAGEPLDDEDRRPWLLRVRRAILDLEATGGSAVVACSALKRAHRMLLLSGTTRARLVYLRGPRDLVAARLRGRGGHFFPPELLDSQLAALEEPQHAITIDVTADVETVTDHVLRALDDATG
jgi:gluconokinase